MVRILAAGDGHVRSQLLSEALQRELAGGEVEVATLDLPWPEQPSREIAEVKEASGDEDELIPALEGVEVLVTQLAPVTEQVFASADELRLVVCTRGGPVNVNVAAASSRDIPVCYTPGRNAPAAAEFALGLMLAAIKRIPAAHASLSRGDWRGEFYSYEENGMELEGATIGLVGFGSIGRRITSVLRAFGSEVLVYDPFVEPTEVEEAGARKAGLEELLRNSQVVSLHARLTGDTKGMIGSEQIALMSEGSVLVNTARGGLLDYDALCDALQSRHLGAAALDVYDEEPPPEGSRLFEAPNLVLSPHMAGATRQTAHRAADTAAAEVRRYVRGQKLAAVANRDALTS